MGVMSLGVGQGADVTSLLKVQTLMMLSLLSQKQWKKKDWHKNMTEMLKGIAASDGVAVAKAYLLVQPDLSSRLFQSKIQMPGRSSFRCLLLKLLKTSFLLSVKKQ